MWVSLCEKAYAKACGGYEALNFGYVEEALHRLVELHYKLGLISEAEKYAYLLGYNYQSSKWYEASYKMLGQNYERDKVLIKDNSDTILKKFKKLFK